ncbi:MAG: nicotinate (nicotinamide) nucleotide adenylyltransferase [bacterium]|nr:nicotinate (nicotinamide) nucleotide adenylyltransferase [bacterium]
MRLAVFGGAFDPFHAGHLAVIRELLARRLCDRVLVVPAGRSPLKPPAQASADDRLAMARLGAAGLAEVEIWDGELARPGPSWTVDTLEALAALHPKDELRLVLGADAWRDLGAWHRPERVRELALPVVLARDGRAPDPRDLPPGAVVLSGFAVPGASGDIRAKLHAGQPPEDLLPPAIAAYVRERRLYGCGKDDPCR